MFGPGKSPTGISEALGVAHTTVADQCRRIKGTLGLDRPFGLIRFAPENRVEGRASRGFGEQD